MVRRLLGIRMYRAGDCVRTLLVYAEALDSADEGWLSAEDSFKQWIFEGGNPQSTPERIGYQRGKVRTQLKEAGVPDSERKRLWERRTHDGQPEMRLTLKTANIEFDEVD